MKASLIGWAFYWALTAWLVLLGSLIGIALLLGALLWFIAKTWVFDTFFELDSGGGVLNYTLDYIWNASTYVRSFFLVSVLALSLGGLGWLSTEDLRLAEAEPTFTERVSETASSVAETTSEKAGAIAEATKETTKGWISDVKGWFAGESEDATVEE